MNNLYLFDCFGVVVTEVSSMWLNAHFDEQEKAYIRQNIFRQLDTGKISHKQAYEILSTRHGMTVKQIMDEWDTYLAVKWDTVELIQKLRNAGGTVALLSNASVEYIDYVFDRFDLKKYFDKMFVSAAYGYAKPDLEFYRIGVSSFDKKFDNIYFTDDNPANLVNIEQFGITPILFTSVSDVAKKLGI